MLGFFIKRAFRASSTAARRRSNSSLLTTSPFPRNLHHRVFSCGKSLDDLHHSHNTQSIPETPPEFYKSPYNLYVLQVTYVLCCDLAVQIVLVPAQGLNCWRKRNTEAASFETDERESEQKIQLALQLTFQTRHLQAIQGSACLKGVIN